MSEYEEVSDVEESYEGGIGAVDVMKKTLKGYVGFSNLPNQIHRRSVKKGFSFTLMVCGESGLGKSTLVNTLFNAAMYPDKEDVELSTETPSTVEIQSVSGEITENGISLKLTVLDTPGFGDFINNENCWKPILDNIESRYDAFLEQESRVNRKKIVDNRVHALIYFIAPTGHCLKPLDIEFMKRLHLRVNLIPVIAKSDALTEDELTAFKQRILEDITFNKINIYQPSSDEFDDDETIAENQELLAKMPFGIVGSNELVESQGKLVRGRQYPWGVLEVDNEEHNDFVKLRQMLIRTHMEDLREHTVDVLYENYRSEKLAAFGGSSMYFQNSDERSPMTKFEEEKRQHEAKLVKMETEMKQVFQQKVAEKETKLRQSEEELLTRHREMKEFLDRQRHELEEKKRRLESLRNGGATPDRKAGKKGFFKS